MLPHAVVAHEAGIVALDDKHRLGRRLPRLNDKVRIAVGAKLVSLLQLSPRQDWLGQGNCKTYVRSFLLTLRHCLQAMISSMVRKSE